MLGGILGRIANTVHNDVVQPIQRDALIPVHNLLFAQAGGAIRHLVGNPQERQAAQVQQAANNAYQFTPAFNQLISKAHPVVDNSLNGAVADSLTNKSRGPFTPFNGIRLTPGGDNRYAMLHEGLHDAWAHQTPQMKQAYLTQLQRVINSPGGITANLGFSSDAPVAPKTLRQYLDNSLSTYGGYKGINSLNNLASLNPNLQNEIHSFVPEFYQDAQTGPPTPLANYYRQYFNPQRLAGFQ